MDIVLLIIAIIFLCDKERKHSFTTVAVLSLIGLVITIILCAVTNNSLYVLDVILYIIILILCWAGNNRDS